MSDLIVCCASCGKSLGQLVQEGLPGIPRERLCPECATVRRTEMMLKCCPEDGEPQWLKLSEWEQTFLTSIREQYARRTMMTEKQYQVLERIWEKV